jgi:hypothetical protein
MGRYKPSALKTMAILAGTIMVSGELGCGIGSYINGGLSHAVENMTNPEYVVSYVCAGIISSPICYAISNYGRKPRQKK